MSLVPQSKIGKVEFYEAHIGPWTTNAVAVGLTAPACTALAAATTAARAAFNTAEVARNASKAATQAFYDAVTLMHSAPGYGSDMIETIRNYAETKNQPNVYNLAQIPPPATPSETPPPGTPSNFTVGLLQNGALELKWKCNNPAGTAGTIYEVRRTINGSAEFVGATGVRVFVDDTLPNGSAPATYQLTAVRSTQRGNPAQFTVQFGVGGGGGMMITGVSEMSPQAVKMAA